MIKKACKCRSSGGMFRGLGNNLNFTCEPAGHFPSFKSSRRFAKNKKKETTREVFLQLHQNHGTDWIESFIYVAARQQKYSANNSGIAAYLQNQFTWISSNGALMNKTHNIIHLNSPHTRRNCRQMRLVTSNDQFWRHYLQCCRCSTTLFVQIVHQALRASPTPIIINSKKYHLITLLECQTH